MKSILFGILLFITQVWPSFANDILPVSCILELDNFQYPNPIIIEKKDSKIQLRWKDSERVFYSFQLSEKETSLEMAEESIYVKYDRTIEGPHHHKQVNNRLYIDSIKSEGFFILFTNDFSDVRGHNDGHDRYSLTQCQQVN